MARTVNKLSAVRVYFFQLLFNSLNPSDFWVQRRWETPRTDDMNIPTANRSSGCLAALAINALRTFGLGGTVSGLVWQGMNGELAPGINQGRRGPHHLLTSGPPEASHNITYFADSMEVIFDARESTYMDFLDTLLSAGPNIEQAGYISVRPSCSSRATLSMHNVAGSHAVSIEVATLQGLPGNAAWMSLVQQEALKRGGRPHWGQLNKLDELQVSTLYGRDVDNWRAALRQVSGDSTVFSNSFTRQRRFEPAEPERKVTAVSQSADELLVVGSADSGNGDGEGRFARWTSTTPWAGWQPLVPITTPVNHFIASAAADGRAHLFWIADDGAVVSTTRRADGVWSGWRPIGLSQQRGWQGVAGSPVHAVSCAPQTLHMFYANRQGRICMSRSLDAGDTWQDTQYIGPGRTAPGGYVSAVSRRVGQLDVFTVGTDSRVYTNSWNAQQDWGPWGALEGVTCRPGNHVCAVSRRLDFLDIFVASQTGQTMSAAWNPLGAGWGGWWHIQGGMTDPNGYVTAISRSIDRLDIFVKGTDRKVYSSAWEAGSAWQPWFQINGAMAQSAVWPVSRSPDKLDIFSVEPNGAVQTAAWEPGQQWGGPWTIA